MAIRNKIFLKKSLKYFLTLVIFSISLKILAFSAKITVIEGYKSKVHPNCLVQVIGENGKIIKEGMTNQEGKILFEGLKNDKVKFSVKDQSGNYMEGNAFSTKDKYQNHTIVIYPTLEYEKEMMSIEDSIYGVVSENESTKEKLDLDSIDVEATYIGGVNEMFKFIGNQLIYPRECIEMNEQGRVIVTFIVEKDGALTHVKILNSPSLLLGCEAKRIVRSMPNWQPGTFKGKSARTRCKLPIKFALT